jgi:indolepyruvate ferredoxin oxidoreductase alpha subunit
MDRSQAGRLPAPVKVTITDDCTGCRHCVTRFECPALLYDEAGKRVVIDGILCTGCGVCLRVCPLGAIRAGDGQGSTGT